MAFLLAARRGAAIAGFRGLPRGRFLVLCVAATVNVFAFFQAYLWTSIANVLLIHYVAPVLVAFLSPFLLKELPTNRTWAALALSIAGIALVFRASATGAGARETAGIWLAFLSAVSYAAVLLLARGLARAGGDPVALTVGQSAMMWFLALCFFEPEKLTLRGSVLAAGAGTLHLAIAAWLHIYGLRSVRAAAAGVLGYSEVVFGMLWGAVVYGEALRGAQGIGGLLIIGGGAMILLDRGCTGLGSVEKRGEAISEKASSAP